MEVFYQKQRRFFKWLWRTFWLNTMYRDAYYMGWDAALENAEALKPPHNTPCMPCPECGRTMRVVCTTVGCENNDD
jgi:hypothetical protein